MMVKEKWLRQLKSALYKMPKQERLKALEFYLEMIDDKIESGESEDFVIKSLGSPQEVAKKILDENGIEHNPKNQNVGEKIVESVHKMPLWAVITIGFFAVTVGLPIAIGLGATLFSLVVTFWAVFGAMVGTAAGCIVLVFASCFFNLFGLVGNGFALLGASILGLGVAMLLAVAFWYLAVYTTKFVVYICKKLFKGGNSHEKK